MTRGALLLRGALAAATVYGAGAVTPLVRSALAQSDASDAAILDFALRLEILEATFYGLALKQVPRMSREVMTVTTVLHENESEHEKAVAETIRQLGVRSSPRPKFAFGDAFSSEARYLQTAQLLEDTGVAAYNGAAPKVFASRILAIAGSVVQVEARHAAIIRDLRGQPITPGAFETPLDQRFVEDRVGRFFAAR